MVSQQARAKAALVVVGSINHDWSVSVDALPSPGETIIANASRSSVGGKGANQAVGAARAGATVEFVGAVGADTEGGVALRTLGEAGVGTRGIRSMSETPTGRAWVMVDASGENSIIVAPGANRALTAEQAVQSLHSIVDSVACEKVVVLCQGELPFALIERVAAATLESGWRFILNLAPFAPVCSQTLAAARPLVVNQTEASQLVTHLGLTPADNISRQLADAIGTSVVVTLGSRGAAWADGPLHGEVFAHRVENVVDTTGAGDAFVGALAAALCNGEDLPSAIQKGSRAGAAAVQHFGPQQ